MVFIFNKVKKLVGGATIRKFQKETKTGYISTRRTPLEAPRVSKEAEKFMELKFLCLVLYFSVKIKWPLKNHQQIIIFGGFLLISSSFSEFIQF